MCCLLECFYYYSYYFFAIISVLENYLFVYFGLWSLIRYWGKCLPNSKTLYRYTKQMLLNLFLRYLLCYLLIAIIIFCAVIWLVQRMALFDTSSYSCHGYIEAFPIIVQQYQNTKYTLVRPISQRGT